MGDAEIEAPADETVAITDIKLGDGEMADVGDTVNVGYKGQLGDASGATFDQAKSFTFTLGAGDVIKGWDQGELSRFTPNSPSELNEWTTVARSVA